MGLASACDNGFLCKQQEKPGAKIFYVHRCCLTAGFTQLVLFAAANEQWPYSAGIIIDIP